MAIIDTDFLSSFLKIKRLPLIFEALNINALIIPGAVLHELEKAPFYKEVFELIQLKEIIVKNVEEANFSEELGIGETECFSLAQQTGDLLLTNDQRAIKYAELRGIIVSDISTFLFYCKKNSFVSQKEMRNIINLLKEKDYYVFSEEVKEELLK